MEMTMSGPQAKQKLPSPKTAAELLDIYYLPMRSALLETAAGLDRIQRAAGGEEAMKDPRVQRLMAGGGLLAGEGDDRALQFQELLSEK